MSFDCSYFYQLQVGFRSTIQANNQLLFDCTYFHQLQDGFRSTIHSNNQLLLNSFDVLQLSFKLKHKEKLSDLPTSKSRRNINISNALPLITCYLVTGALDLLQVECKLRSKGIQIQFKCLGHNICQICFKRPETLYIQYIHKNTQQNKCWAVII